MEHTYKGIRVLVTGAGGFIGSRLVMALVDAGAEVSVSVRSKESAWRLQSVISKIAVYEANLLNPLELMQVIENGRPDIVFNVASSTDTRRTFDILDSVILGTYGVARAVLGACITGGVQKLVHFGTIEEYGMGPELFLESAHEKPVSPYSLGKTMATHAVLLAGRLTALKVCVVRPASTFGPGKDFGLMLIPNLIKSGIEGREFDMNDGEQWRDFIYVDDVVRGALMAGISEKVNGEIINLGSGKRTKVREVAEVVNNAMGNSIKINFGSQEYRPLDGDACLNSDKAYELLRWKASTDIIDGIEKTVAWYREYYKDLL